MAANPFRCVQVSVEAQLLLVRYQVWVGRVHVLGGRWYLFLVQRREQVGWVRKIRIVTVEGVRVGIALEHSE